MYFNIIFHHKHGVHIFARGREFRFKPLQNILTSYLAVEFFQLRNVVHLLAYTVEGYRQVK